MPKHLPLHLIGTAAALGGTRGKGNIGGGGVKSASSPKGLLMSVPAIFPAQT